MECDQKGYLKGDTRKYREYTPNAAIGSTQCHVQEAKSNLHISYCNINIQRMSARTTIKLYTDDLLKMYQIIVTLYQVFKIERAIQQSLGK